MSDFNLREYQNTDNNTKRKVFFEYLYELFGLNKESDNFNNENFLMLNEEDLINSLKYYISKNFVTAQVTAKNYITYIEEFFRMLSDEYNIKNEIFINRDLYNKFYTKTKDITSKLKNVENKGIASDEQFEMLNNGIEEYLINSFDENEVYDEICKHKEGSSNYIKFYNRFVSIISIKLIMKFALSNIAVVSLDFENLDIENKTLNINDGIMLELDEELLQLFKMYLKFRSYILQLYSIRINKLFVKCNGESYITNYPNREVPDYRAFFMIMDDYLKTRSADLFADRRILEMLNKGLDISTIAKLTGVSIKKLVQLQESSNKDTSINEKIQHFLKDTSIDKKIKIKKKGYLECPYCSKSVKAISDEWILVQFENDDKKYLACKECRGQDEKFSI